MSSAGTVECTLLHHMNMDIDDVIVEDELDDQLGDLLLAELLNSTAQAEQLVADLVGSSAGRCTAKRRIMLRSMSKSEFRDDGGMYAESFCSANSFCVSCLGAMSWMQGALNNNIST